MSGLEPFFFGSAAGAGAAATSGLFGAGGAFSLGTTLSTVGGIAGAAGALSAGRSQQQASNYNAESARIEAESRAAAQRAENTRRMGTLRANIGKSGATSAGTPLLVLAESAANAEIDALNTLYTGQRQSDLYRMQGSNARRAGNINAGTSLLTTAGRIF